jgi:hypothetical protein
MAIKDSLNKLILIKENDWLTTNYLEYREYEREENNEIIFHKKIFENVEKETLNKMMRTMIFKIGDHEFNLNKDKSISLMSLGELNQEELNKKLAIEEKQNRIQALQEKINKRKSK